MEHISMIYVHINYKQARDITIVNAGRYSCAAQLTTKLSRQQHNNMQSMPQGYKKQHFFHTVQLPMTADTEQYTFLTAWSYVQPSVGPSQLANELNLGNQI